MLFSVMCDGCCVGYVFWFFLGKIVIYRWVSHIVYVAKSRGTGCRKLIMRCDEVCAHTSQIHCVRDDGMGSRLANLVIYMCFVTLYFVY